MEKIYEKDSWQNRMEVDLELVVCQDILALNI